MDNNVTFTIVHPVTGEQTPVKVVKRDEKCLLQVGATQLSVSRQQMLELGSLLVAMAENNSVDNLDYDSVHELLHGFEADASKVYEFALRKLEE